MRFSKTLLSLIFTAAILIVIPPVPLNASSPLQLSIQQSNSCAFSVLTCTVTATSAIIDRSILLIAIDTGGGDPITSVTDTVGLVFKQRAVTWRMQEWYAQTTSVVTNDVVTVTRASTSTNQWFLSVSIVYGADVNSPFDLPTPVTATTASGCTAFPTISTLSQNTLVTGIGGSDGNIAFVTDPGFTSVTVIHAFGGSFGVEESTFQITQSALPVSFNQTLCGGGSSTWGMILDAFCNACIANQGERIPNPVGQIQSVSGPAGFPIPPQLADQKILGYVFLLSAGIALSSIRLERKKKTERRLRLG